jgi:hypothetical protein
MEAQEAKRTGSPDDCMGIDLFRAMIKGQIKRSVLDELKKCEELCTDEQVKECLMKAGEIDEK